MKSWELKGERRVLFVLISSFKSQGKHIFEEIGIGSKENNQFGGFFIAGCDNKIYFQLAGNVLEHH